MTTFVISAEGEKLMYDVKTLRDVERYTVYRYDKNECLRFDTATLYRIDGHWYALDYSALENNNFDADGKLSYRSGNVYLVRLSDDTNRRVVWTFSEIESFNCEYSHESDKIYAELREQENEDNAVVYTISFYFFFVILGFIVPIPFMVLGFVLPMIKKLGKPKYWYVISVLAFLWMVVALVLLILTFL